MPEATIVFEDGRSMRILVENFRLNHGLDIPAVRDRAVGRIANTVELSGLVIAETHHVSLSESFVTDMTDQWVAKFGAKQKREKAKPVAKPPKKPKPQSAWDRLLADDLLEGAR